jgi:hypothetical protein
LVTDHRRGILCEWLSYVQGHWITTRQREVLDRIKTPLDVAQVRGLLLDEGFELVAEVTGGPDRGGRDQIWCHRDYGWLAAVHESQPWAHRGPRLDRVWVWYQIEAWQPRITVMLGSEAQWPQHPDRHRVIHQIGALHARVAASASGSRSCGRSAAR